MNWITVNDMYQYAKDNNLKLLSDCSATFWSDYISNSARYDKLFARLYSSFRYFYQDKDSVIATLTTDFIDEVKSHLILNNKKYEELYRVKVLSDANYNFTGNVNLTDVMDRSFVNGSRSDTEGQRIDSTSTTIGGKTDTDERQVAPFNSSTYSNADKSTTILGSQTNSDSFTKGSQTNSIGQQTNTEDYTLTRTGKTGDKSMAEYIEGHINLWTEFEFYSYIFNDICSELLLV